VKEVRGFLKEHAQIQGVMFVCFDEATFKVYEEFL
jgi:O-acetyl-ADP-ribose deacetylase (regulator of RNase III)